MDFIYLFQWLWNVTKSLVISELTLAMIAMGAQGCFCLHVLQETGNLHPWASKLKALVCPDGWGKGHRAQTLSGESSIKYLCGLQSVSVVEDVGCIALLQYGLTSETEIKVDLIIRLKGTQKRFFVDPRHTIICQGREWVHSGQEWCLEDKEAWVHPQENNPSALDTKPKDYAQERMQCGIVTLQEYFL